MPCKHTTARTCPTCEELADDDRRHGKALNDRAVIAEATKRIEARLTPHYRVGSSSPP